MSLKSRPHYKSLIISNNEACHCSFLAIDNPASTLIFNRRRPFYHGSWLGMLQILSTITIFQPKTPNEGNNFLQTLHLSFMYKFISREPNRPDSNSNYTFLVLFKILQQPTQPIIKIYH
ncbi:hypothetical protein ES319_D05G268000v1 [Gossypium barbadense]|uniref:Uncharacterized protein n=2 Tax=Gossypium TaxID=3633 RepID=A0A0D2UUM0_GOSRA|nr:hypothetical protein ES319_D05G268000v1 [Gossypium barbadense]KJB59730.1 hypothetical protein B456_009G268700 [Gossypium raimondii]